MSYAAVRAKLANKQTVILDGAIGTAKKTTGTSHPASLSLDPPDGADGAPLSTVSTELGHTGVVFQRSCTDGLLLSVTLRASSL